MNDTPEQLNMEDSSTAVNLPDLNATQIVESDDHEESDKDSSSSENADVDQEGEEEDYEQKASPYHLIGFCCFCTSIIFGIICVLTSTLLRANDSATTDQLKYIFGTLFGTFLFSLFLCLCCTYYLGASKESWEIPTFKGIRKNFANFVAVAGLVIEFVQICSFSFNRTQLFASIDLGKVNLIAVPVGNDEPFFIPVYWVFFVVAFSPYLFVIIVRVFIYVYTVKKGESAAANIVEQYQEKIHSVLWFLVNALYLPVCGTMVAGTSCTFGATQITLDATFLICSMLALIIYYPAASFAQAQTQNISDIKFKPRIVFIMLQGKFAIVLISRYFTTHYYIYYSGLLAINILFLVLNILGQPCLVQWVNKMRTVFFAMTVWATFCSGVVGNWILNDEYSKVPAVLLLVVWGVMLIGFPLLFLFWDRCKVNILTLVVKVIGEPKRDSSEDNNNDINVKEEPSYNSYSYNSYNQHPNITNMQQQDTAV